MSTPDYTTQATEYVATAEMEKIDVKGWVDPENGDPWHGWRITVTELNCSVDLGAYDEEHARSKAVDYFTAELERRAASVA